MRRYTLKVVIHEGNDEFWESLENKTGCDEVQNWIQGLLEAGGGLYSTEKDSNYELTLTEFSSSEDSCGWAVAKKP